MENAQRVPQTILIVWKMRSNRWMGQIRMVVGKKKNNEVWGFWLKIQVKSYAVYL